VKRNMVVTLGVFTLFLVFVAVSAAVDFNPGVSIGLNFRQFALEMLKILPFAFMLIGLFEVWVPRQTVEQHLGTDSGLAGHLWAVALASMTVGGAYVGFPVAYSLWRKGAGYGSILTYIGAAAIVRVPMTIFEATFLGLRFSLVRLLVSLPLVIATSWVLGSYLTRVGFRLPERELEAQD